MNHSFNTKVAELYGLEEAILLENIYFWCKKNETNNKLTQGKPWTYNTVKAFNLQFKYLSPAVITRALKNLVKYKLIEVGEFNTNAYDHTKWYCVTDRTRSFFEDTNNNSSSDYDKSNYENNNPNYENSKSNMQKSQTNITDINTDDNTDINTDDNTDIDSPGSLPEKEPKSNSCKKTPVKQKKEKPPKHKYGEFGNVLLTDDEYQKLVDKLGKEKADAVIKNYSEIKEMKGYKYNSDYMALLKWGIRAYEDNNRYGSPSKPNYNRQPFHKGFDREALNRKISLLDGVEPNYE